MNRKKTIFARLLREAGPRSALRFARRAELMDEASCLVHQMLVADKKSATSKMLTAGAFRRPQ